MTLRRDAFRAALAVLAVCGALVVCWALGGLDAPDASAQTADEWLVTSDADTGAAGTLRWAIGAANESAGDDVIRFASAMTIRPRSPLPKLSDDGISVDATRTNAAATVDIAPRVWIDGSRAGDASGLELVARRGQVRGLGVVGFQRYGIGLIGVDAVDAELVGNWVGLAANGLASPNRLGGVAVLGGAARARIAQNRLGGNSVEGRTGHGIVVGGDGSVGVQIEGNLIGIALGGGAAPNDDGILIVDSAQAEIRDNTIGNSKVAGIELRDARLRSTVDGNRIGLRRDGAAAPNDVGVFLGPGSANATVGAQRPNIVAANRVGIAVEQGARDAEIRSNWIGLVPASGRASFAEPDLRAAVSMPNRIRGISVIAGAAYIQVLNNYVSAGTYGIVVDGAATARISLTRNVVAGASNGATEAAIDVRAGAEINIGGDQGYGNHVCGAEYGIRVAATDEILIRSNAVGAGAAARATFDSDANTRWGIYLRDGVTRARAQWNFIAGVSAAAISVVGATSLDNRLTENQFGWNGIDIDLGADGPSENDAGDRDRGPNGMLNRPRVEHHRVSNLGADNYRSILSGQASPGSYVEVYEWRDASWNRVARSQRADGQGRWTARTSIVPRAPIRALAVTGAGSTSEFSEPFLPSQRVRLRNGRAFFAWTGTEMPIAQAFASLTPGLDRWIETVWRWNAEQAAWEGWSPRVSSSVNGALQRVRAGDVLRLQLANATGRSTDRPPQEFFVPAAGTDFDLDPESIPLSAGFNNVAWLGGRLVGRDALQPANLTTLGIDMVWQWNVDRWQLIWSGPGEAWNPVPGAWQFPVFWIHAARDVTLGPP